MRAKEKFRYGTSAPDFQEKLAATRQRLLGKLPQVISGIEHTTLDVETTYQIVNGRADPSPYHPNNRLISVGYKRWELIKKEAVEQDYICFYHKKALPTYNAKKIIQGVLDRTKLLVGHNIKFDLSWLWECGFKYDGDIFDTMIAEYVISKAQKLPLDLSECCARYGIAIKYHELAEYILNRTPFDEIPYSTITTYGIRDVNITDQLFLAQLNKLMLPAAQGLVNQWWDDNFINPAF